MGKKGKKGKAVSINKNASKRGTNTGDKKKRYTIIGILVLVGIFAGFSLSSFMSGTQKKVDYQSITDPSQLRGGETKPVLSPALFMGRTARAYAVAKEIPEVLDSMYCYCNCKIHSGHKSLLSCYTGDHAAYCDICQNEALRTYELYKKGLDVLSIRKAIDREFGG